MPPKRENSRARALNFAIRVLQEMRDGRPRVVFGHDRTLMTLDAWDGLPLSMREVRRAAAAAAVDTSSSEDDSSVDSQNVDALNSQDTYSTIPAGNSQGSSSSSSSSTTDPTSGIHGSPIVLSPNPSFVAPTVTATTIPATETIDTSVVTRVPAPAPTPSVVSSTSPPPVTVSPHRGVASTGQWRDSGASPRSPPRAATTTTVITTPASAQQGKLHFKVIHRH